MSQIVKTTNPIGQSLRRAREQRGWSGGELAAASGVSRAMIDRIERGASSPTAELLGRLTAALGITMSRLFADSEAPGTGVTVAADRSSWTDPSTGYVRRQVAATPSFPVDVTEVTLPPGQRVTYPAASYAFTRHLLWVLEGTLTFTENETTVELGPGDTMLLGEPSDCSYQNRSGRDCRYAVIVAPA